MSGRTIYMDRVVSVTERLLKDLTELKKRPPRILIVEDDSSDLFFMKRGVEAMGGITDSARSFNEAIRKIDEEIVKKEPFDLILLDLRLQGYGDGLDILKKLKASADRTPVVIVTGSLEFFPFKDLENIGGYFSVIKKPLSAPDVKEILEKHRIFS